MVKQWSITLMERLSLIRDTVEHSLFYLALAGIVLCGVLFLVIPSSTAAKDSGKRAADLSGTLSETLAGAGTEKAVEAEGAGDTIISASEQLLINCSNDLEQAFQTVRESTQANQMSGSEIEAVPPIEAASLIGYSALSTVAENRMMSYTDYSTLLQIVEAECTGGDELSKQYVACVVLNRTKDEHFPDTVYDVVWQRLYGHAQFSPTQDGRMGRQKITDTTISAVNKAVTEEDIAQGALFFIAREHAARSNVNWFDTELEYLFSYGGHEFFRFKDEMVSEENTEVSP